MKTLTALLLTLFCSVNLFAQNAKIDSLQKVIATTKVDTGADGLTFLFSA